jgi:hypothetical protein
MPACRTAWKAVFLMNYRLKRWVTGETILWQGLVRKSDGSFEWGDADHAHNFTSLQEVKDQQRVHGGMLMHDRHVRDDGPEPPPAPPLPGAPPHGRNWLNEWEQQHEHDDS